ncbi:hypothetical protein FD724_00700 [Nostoc sp. C057]|uniref:hypothetical protein n=1 Tax=Nostoc sp. C057 TaxID=2576903 RepID=UPI0015C2EB0A|nr:hypothetical protein [Nostoc sp. C057]QLE46825.1 hypothetical protein FD724_00700 [Nostoc sp. C057]
MPGIFENIGRQLDNIGRLIDNVVSPKEQKTQQKPVDRARISQPVDNSLQKLTVALHLVVPVFVVNNTKENHLITASDIEKLIDNARYFLCTKSAVPDLIEDFLKFTDENISTIHERSEIYIRINIPDGQEMLDKKVPYILKRNLPSHGQGVVRKIACLEDLSGLEKFNRI